MAQFETWASYSVHQFITPKLLPGNLFEGDSDGNILGVKIYRDGNPETLSGTVKAKITRADGSTREVTGSINGNAASVALPSSAYEIPGHIQIVLRVGTTTVGCFTGSVVKTKTNRIIS